MDVSEKPWENNCERLLDDLWSYPFRYPVCLECLLGQVAPPSSEQGCLSDGWVSRKPLVQNSACIISERSGIYSVLLLREEKLLDWCDLHIESWPEQGECKACLYCRVTRLGLFILQMDYCIKWPTSGSVGPHLRVLLMWVYNKDVICLECRMITTFQHESSFVSPYQHVRIVFWGEISIDCKSFVFCCVGPSGHLVAFHGKDPAPHSRQ